MTIWILAILMLASGAGLGLRQGAIRTAFSFAGIVLGAWLAVPLGKLLFKPLLPHLGIHNPMLIWMIPPLEAFAIVLILFKVAGFIVHRKADAHYKSMVNKLNKLDEVRVALWQRLNSRLGLCVGILNGAAYLVLVAFVIYNLTYWTVQLASTDDENYKIRFINRLGRDLESSGLDKAARSVAPMPDVYYKLADLGGLLCQNPDLGGQLASYPPFLSLIELDDFQQLVQDKTFTDNWKQHTPAGQLLNDAQVKAILQNNDLINTVFTVVETNLDDLLTYLQTGESPKYDSEKILGRWEFNVGATVGAIRLAHPNISSGQMRSVRAAVTTAYAAALFIFAPDHQVFLKNFPHVKIEKNQPPATEKLNFKGAWQENGTNYDLSLTDVNGGNPQTMQAHFEDSRMVVASGESVLVFRHEN